MKTRSFYRLFPPPRYLMPPALGLDISDQSVKWFGLEPAGHRLVVTGYGEKAIPLGVIESGKIKDKTGLIQTLSELRHETNSAYVAASLPEEETYIVRMRLPAEAAGDWRGTIELQLEEHVPLPANQAVFDYELATTTGTEKLLAVSVLPLETVAAYSQVIEAAGFSLQGLEMEAQAIARAFLPTGATGGSDILLVDFGKTRISFMVARAGVVLLSSTVKNVGGEDLTVSIQKNLGLGREAAEAVKVEGGLLKARKNQELFASIFPLVSVLRDEIKKQIDYWLSEHGKIERVILGGGQATLPGLLEYLSLALNLPVAVGNVWINVLDPAKEMPRLSRNQSLRYATALGLALRNLELS